MVLLSVDGHHGAMGEPTSPQPAGPWTIEVRGRFTVGTCRGCGYVTPARRARYSAEKDLEAHSLLCEAGSDGGEPLLEPTESRAGDR